MRKWTAPVIAAAMFLAVSVIGCDEDGPVDNGGGVSEPITVTTIIVNPKSPAPGDTILLTARIVSDGQNVGDFPTITWSSGGVGSFLENGELTVRWVAPTTSQLVTIAVTAKNSVSTSSTDAIVFVGSSTQLIASQAGQMFLISPALEFAYLRTPDIRTGIELYRYDNGVVSDAVPGVTLGENFAISRSLTATGFEIQPPPAQYLVEPINVFYQDVTAGTETQVSFDRAEITSRRRHQYTDPALSSDGMMMAYQAFRPAPLAVSLDSTDIFVYYATTGRSVAVTETHGIVRRNYLPTFSPDGNWLMFVGEREQNNEWEYYGLPISGGVVDTMMSATTRLTQTNGQITSFQSGVIQNPVKLWNPTSSILAVVTSEGALLQATIDASGGTSVVVPLLNRPRELKWSPDGSVLAFSDGQNLYTMPAGGSALTPAHTAAVGDQIRDLVWSPDGALIAYRIVRASISWFELVDPTNASMSPIVLTPASSTGSLSTYQREMSMSPLWLPSDELVYLQFTNGTPGVFRIDISAALQ